MKAPRREFVVEYKSTRRPIKTQPKSIWGNLDLGAVARQVDADDVLPAAQPTRPEPVETQRVEPTSPSNAVTDTAEVPEKVDDRQPLSDADTGTIKAVLPPDIEVPVDASTPAEVVSPLSPRTRKRTSATRKLSPRSSDAPHAILPSAELDDDIEALDAENRRLRRLVLDKVRSENDWLQSILDRFENIPEIDLG